MEKKCIKFKSHIIRNEALQGGNKEYYCVVCKKQISRSQCYYHQSCANKEERPYMCVVCNKKFASKYHLNYHLKAHTEKQCRCLQCGQTMINSVVLKKHERLHCKAKCTKSSELLPCNACPRKYKQMSALQRHRLKHIERKYECKQCNKQFKRNSSLKAHMKRHGSVKYISCSICYRLLKDNAALHRHLKLHKDNEKYKCTICSTTTSRKDNMLRHLRNMHNDVAFEQPFEVCDLSKRQYAKQAEENQLDSNSDALDGAYNSIYDHIPKTIENSSVIKYVGNVKPIMIPKEKNAGDNLEYPSPQEEEYDPIEMYRKILTMTDSTEVI